MHPVKVERHDTARGLHHTNTGVRDVETYAVHPGGLYVSRPFVGHARIRHWEAHLLPRLGVQLCRYTLHGDRREFDWYLDIADIRETHGTWEVRDLYLDVLVWEAQRAEIIDTDELLGAVRGGLLEQHEALWAVERAHDTLNALARHGYRVNDWLAEHDLRLQWTDLAAPPSHHRERPLRAGQQQL